MSEGVCGSNQQLMEVKRELEHAQSKIATLEKRLFRAEEAADVADLERNEAQKARDQLLKRVASMDRRLSGNFNTLQKVGKLFPAPYKNYFRFRQLYFKFMN